MPGHILGSAIAVLDIEDEDEANERLVWYLVAISAVPTGPFSTIRLSLTRLMCCSLRARMGTGSTLTRLKRVSVWNNVVNETCRRGGKLIVPAFAVGRTQELVYRLHQLVEAGDISAKLPVFVDSPLAIDATGYLPLAPRSI